MYLHHVETIQLLCKWMGLPPDPFLSDRGLAQRIPFNQRVQWFRPESNRVAVWESNPHIPLVADGLPLAEQRARQTIDPYARYLRTACRTLGAPAPLGNHSTAPVHCSS